MLAGKTSCQFGFAGNDLSYLKVLEYNLGLKQCNCRYTVINYYNATQKTGSRSVRSKALKADPRVPDTYGISSYIFYILFFKFLFFIFRHIHVCETSTYTK